MLAPFFQILVCSLLVSLTTILAKNITAGLYTLGGYVILSGAWGTASIFFPSGQASLSRLTNQTAILDQHYTSLTIESTYDSAISKRDLLAGLS